MGQEAIPVVHEGSEGPRVGPGGVGRSGRAQEALPEVPEGSGGPPEGAREVMRPSWRV